MLKVSVSNLECFRIWMEDDDLEAGWLMDRLLGRVEQTSQQRAGEMLHKALETVGVGTVEKLKCQGWTFLFDADCQVTLTPLIEYPASAQYGDLLVTGRVDAIVGSTIVDYKSGAKFDPDRLLSSYQWRYYLDMMGANRFEWHWFGLHEAEVPRVYRVTDFQKLSQISYPELHDDCENLARDYYTFAKDISALNTRVA